VVGIDAARGWSAGVIGADVAVVTVWRRSSDTHTRETGVCCGTGVAIIAAQRVGHAGAACKYRAEVVRAGIAVVAVGSNSSHANASAAGVGFTARIAVVTCDGVGSAETPRCHVAGVISAGVAIVTVGREPAYTCTRGTHVCGGAGVAVVTGDGDVDVEAASERIAGVGRTNVAVVTIRCSAANAGSGRAGVVGGAGAAIVARGDVGNALASGRRVAAVVGAAVGVVAVRCGTTYACSGRAGVVGGAGVAVITRGCVRRCYASESLVAGVGGTDVTVVTVRRNTAGADTTDADVVGGAGVAVIASR